jgi:hypothetical protein
VARARKLLSELYGGRRIDALDALLLPALPPLAPSTLEERLALRLPTFYAALVLDPSDVGRASIVRSLLEQGFPIPHRVALNASELKDDTRALYARGRLDMGRSFWRAVDFDRAIALFASSPAKGGGTRSEEATLVFALSLALHNGPEDAAELMRRATQEPLGVVDTAALDAVARAKGKYAGMAAFDAALVRQLGAPRAADAAYWNDVAGRFRGAAALLTDPGQRTKAEELSRAAEATAAAVK